MSLKWIVFIMFVWIIGGILGATYEDSWARVNTAEDGRQVESKIELLTDLDNITTETDLLGLFAIPTPNGEYFETLVQVMTFDFEFFPDDIQWLHWILFAPFMVALIFGIVMIVIQILQGFVPG